MTLVFAMEPLPDPAAAYAADAEVARAFRASGAWQPWPGLEGGRTWYEDPWDVLGEVVAGWQASGGEQRRRCRVYLVRMPEAPKTRSAAYPAEHGRWALRDVETIGPAAGYGLTQFYRGEASARADVERVALRAQAINTYLGRYSAAAAAADLAAKIGEIRTRAWREAHEYADGGYRLRKGCTDPAEGWAETPEEIGARAVGLSVGAAPAEEREAA